MNREIGSEFWDIPTTKESNGVFPVETRWFLSGRHALKAILQDVKHQHELRTAALPSWCCESMILPFVEEKYQIYFYPVTVQKGSLSVDYSHMANCDVILLMDYFGYTVPRASAQFSAPIIIRDITHSMFTHTYHDANYYFGSLRKWAGFITGGFAWGNTSWSSLKPLPVDSHYTALRSQAMQLKKQFIEQKQTEKTFLPLFQQAEACLEQLPGIYQGEENDTQQAEKLDVNFIQHKHRENATYLLKQLTPYALFKQLSPADCPLFVPILLKNRDEVRNHLIAKGVYCPVHWPISKFHNLTPEETYIYQHELSVVCDQRYSTADMQYILDCLQEVHLEEVSAC